MDLGLEGPASPRTGLGAQDGVFWARPMSGCAILWNMFERFTNRARRVLVLAQEEARLLNHSFIGTEHILLGLIREGRFSLPLRWFSL